MRLACKENDNVHKKCAKHAFDTLPEENTQRSGKILENTKINLKNRWVKKSWLKREASSANTRRYHEMIG